MAFTCSLAHKRAKVAPIIMFRIEQTRTVPWVTPGTALTINALAPLASDLVCFDSGDLFYQCKDLHSNPTCPGPS